LYGNSFFFQTKDGLHKQENSIAKKTDWIGQPEKTCPTITFKGPYPLRFFWRLLKAVGFVISVMIVIIDSLMVFMKSLEVH
jgi:hypothetical protein